MLKNVKGIVFEHNGTIDISTGRTLTVSGGTFTGKGGGFSGAGILNLTSTTLSLGAGTETIFATGMPVSIRNTTISGSGTLTNQGILNLEGNNTFTSSVTNQGTVNVNVNETIASAFTNASGGIIVIWKLVKLTVTGDFANQGTLFLRTQENDSAYLQVDVPGCPGQYFRLLYAFRRPPA